MANVTYLHDIDRRDGSRGTYLTTAKPFDLYVDGAAMCSDGKVRKLKRIAQSADTWFSIRATVTVGRRTVAGYVTVECESGSDVYVDNTDPRIVKFIATTYHKNHDALPGGAWRKDAS